MTLITPISNRRVTRNGFRKPTNLILPGKRKSAHGPRNSSSAPGSSSKSAAIGQISAERDINSNSNNSNPSPLVGKTGKIPVRRSVSATQRRLD